MKERKKPLVDSHVRAVYARGNRGFPSTAVIEVDECGKISSTCPLKPGVYHLLSRSWCRNWRKFVKGSIETKLSPPDGSILLCDAHKLPLIPPHLEAYLCGENSSLLMPLETVGTVDPCGFWEDSGATVNSNRTINEQRMILSSLGIEDSSAAELLGNNPHADDSGGLNQCRAKNDMLDRENRVVVEILTDEEYVAMGRHFWCHEAHSNSFSLNFSVTNDGIGWSTSPCRECDPSGLEHLHSNSVVFRNRAMRKSPRKWDKK